MPAGSSPVDETLQKMLLCPSAVKNGSGAIVPEGGENPYMSWDDMDDDEFNYYVKFSYSINLYTGNDGGEFWGTPDAKGASYAPIMMDGQWKDSEVYDWDEPPPYEWSNWMPDNHEMRRFCVRRHGRYHVNGVFMDYSVKRYTIKELWMLKWHKNWPAGTDHLPPPGGWPAWMADVPDPVLTWF
jgi:hypothetical protein